MAGPRVLLTAFGPYGPYCTNASSQCLAAVLDQPPDGVELLPRRYPVEFDRIGALVAQDLAQGVDVALHLGQAVGRSRLDLEAVALNLGQDHRDGPTWTLAPGEALALHSPLPLADWAARLNQAGFASGVSHHAGLYLCNACLYWSLATSARMSLGPPATFVHLPPTPEQSPQAAGTWSVKQSAAAVRLLLQTIAEQWSSPPS